MRLVLISIFLLVPFCFIFSFSLGVLDVIFLQRDVDLFKRFMTVATLLTPDQEDGEEERTEEVTGIDGGEARGKQSTTQTLGRNTTEDPDKKGKKSRKFKALRLFSFAYYHCHYLSCSCHRFLAPSREK